MMKDYKILNLSLKIKELFCIFILMLLTSCTDAVCLDADDFGFSTVKVPASYTPDRVHGSGDRQYGEWYDSGLTLSGTAIHVVVKPWDLMYNINSSIELSAWCPWLGPADNPPSLTDICMMLDKCDFQGGDTCSTGADAQITNAPCLLKEGVGLYMLAVPKDFDPNENAATMQDPVNSESARGRLVLKHLGAKTPDVNFYDIQIKPDDFDGSEIVKTGGAHMNLTTQQRKDLVGGKLYFKVLDKHYDDNNGQYIVTVKSGVTSSEWDPTQYIVDLVKDFFFGSATNPHSVSSFNEPGMIRQIFNHVLAGTGYRLAVSSILTLSVMFYAINFLIGNIKMTHHDLVARVVKILIVSQLISNNATWNFFYDNFFTYFIDGSQYLINIIKRTGGAGPGAASLISLMLSPHIFIKLSALIWVSPHAFGFALAYTLIYFLVLLPLVFFGLFYSSVVYITCIVMMGMIISLAPIFLCFLLFENTKSLFDNWLKQLMSYALQPLIVLAGVSLGTIMIRHQIYKTLGFRVCKQDMFFVNHHDNAFKKSIRGDDTRSANAYFWMPLYSRNEVKTKIWLPEAHFEDYLGNKVSASKPGARYCEPYTCQGYRYMSFPFLDPDDPSDARALKLFTSNSRDSFLSMYDMLFIIITSSLLIYFILGATKIATFITGGSMDLTKAVNASGAELGKYAAKAYYLKAPKYAYKGAKLGAKVAVKTIKITYRVAKFIATKGKSEGIGGGKGGSGDAGAMSSSAKDSGGGKK